MLSNWLGHPPRPSERALPTVGSVNRGGSHVASAPVGDRAENTMRVLVVGDTVPGLVLTRLLERDGHTPTLVGRRGDDTLIDAVLAASAAATVDHLVDGSVAATATPVTEIQVNCDCGATAYCAGADPTSLLLDYRWLRRSLRRAIDPKNRRTARIHQLQPCEQGVEVAFAGGERAIFDLVIGADGPNSFVGFLRANSRERDGNVQEWTFRIPRPQDWPNGMVESWDDDAVVTASPVGDGLAVRLGVRGGADGKPMRSTVAAAALSTLRGRLGDAVGNALPERASYRRLPDPGVDPRWRAERIAFCGNAAAPVGRLSGLAPTLGVEDAVTLVDELARSSSVQDALDRYATERTDRLRTLRAAANDAAASAVEYLPVQKPGSLGRLAKLRTVGFASVLGGQDCFGDR